MRLLTLILIFSTMLSTSLKAQADELPQAPTNDRAVLAEVFAQALKELTEVERLLGARQYQAALTKAKQSLDDVRIKSGIHPKASYREKINLPDGALGRNFRNVGVTVKDLDIDAQDAIALAVANHRGGYFLDILNLMKRTNLVYIRAMYEVLKGTGKILERDLEKIRSDILDVHAIPLYLKDARTSTTYFLVFDFEVAQSDQNYLFNRELMDYLLKNSRALGIKNEKAVEQLLNSKVKQVRDEYIRSNGGYVASQARPVTTASAPKVVVNNNRFENANFKRCHTYFSSSSGWSSADATSRCLQREYVSFNFTKNPEFDSCFTLYARSSGWTIADAVVKCMGLAR